MFEPPHLMCAGLIVAVQPAFFTAGGFLPRALLAYSRDVLGAFLLPHATERACNKTYKGRSIKTPRNNAKSNRIWKRELIKPIVKGRAFGYLHNQQRNTSEK
jgi:hypothetical protein